MGLLVNSRESLLCCHVASTRRRGVRQTVGVNAARPRAAGIQREGIFWTDLAVTTPRSASLEEDDDDRGVAPRLWRVRHPKDAMTYEDCC